MEKMGKEFAKSVEERTDSKPKKCPDCEIDLEDDAIYCWKCGKKFSN